MNKKLLKIITCITCGLGITSSIPFMTTSCGSDSFAREVLPDSVYDYTTDEDNNKILNGFTKEFLKNPNKYKSCNTMLISNTVTEIAKSAFYTNIDGWDTTKIPLYIKNLKFEDGDENTLTIGQASFACSCFENLVLTKRIKSIGVRSFGRLSYCSSIQFIGSAKWFINLKFKIPDEQFACPKSYGKISVINGYKNQALTVKTLLTFSASTKTEPFYTWTSEDVDPQSSTNQIDE